MSLELLGEGFDLHCGGADLRFPHHENERAQAVALGKDFAHHWEQNHKSEVDAGKLRDRTFLSNPDVEGDQYRATIDDVQPTGEFTADQREALYRFKCNHKGRDFEEVLTNNQMMDWCSRDLTEDGEYQLEGILGHQRKPGTSYTFTMPLSNKFRNRMPKYMWAIL